MFPNSTVPHSRNFAPPQHCRRWAAALRRRAWLGAVVVVVFITCITASTLEAADRYWDASAGEDNGVGGNATWSFQDDARWSTTETGDASLTSATATDAGIFQGTAGTIVLSGTPFTLASWTFNTTNYTFRTNNATTRELVGSFTLASNVNLNIGAATTTSNVTIQIDGSVNGGSGSSLTIQGKQSSSAAMRLLIGSPSDPTSNDNTISVPITINQTGAGMAGVVSNSSGNAISGTITNNSAGATMLGALASSDSLTVSGKITGSASVRFQTLAGTAASGDGTVMLSGTAGQNDYTGASVINMGSAGTVKLGVDNGLSTGSALQFGALSTSGNVGTLDMNGKNQSVKSLASVTTGTHAISNASATLSTLTINGSATTSYTGTLGASSANNVGLALAATNTGTLILSGTAANTYTGKTTVAAGLLALNKTGVNAIGSTGASGASAADTDLQITGGSVRLDASNQIADTTKLGLSGGTLNLNGNSEGAAGTNGLGALTLSATSTIDFGSGSSSVIQFAGLDGHTTGAILQITNWEGVPTGGSGDRLLFAGSSSAFKTLFADPADVTFNGIAGYSTVDYVGFYEVVPVPEPGTWAAGLLSFGALGYSQRRRLKGVVLLTGGTKAG